MGDEKCPINYEELWIVVPQAPRLFPTYVGPDRVTAMGIAAYARFHDWNATDQLEADGWVCRHFILSTKSEEHVQFLRNQVDDITAYCEQLKKENRKLKRGVK